jgi:hypothetical protein
MATFADDTAILAVGREISSSTRRLQSVAREVGISQTSVCRILKENKFHPYHVQLVQELKETDFERKLDFCHFIRTQMQVDNNFIQKILFSDEAKFSNNGMSRKYVPNPSALELEKNYIKVWGRVVYKRKYARS